MTNFNKAANVLGITLLAILVVGLIVSLPVWLLWNHVLVQAVNGVNHITWAQAWGLMVLSGFLFRFRLSPS